MSTKYIFCHGWCRIIHREGIVAASLGRLLKNRGLKVTIQKSLTLISILTQER